MIKETYIQRDTNQIITIDIKAFVFTIGDEIHTLIKIEKDELIKLYKYDKEIFKEFIENIYIKYDLSIISFLIKNKITLKEIKEITNIVLFPVVICNWVSIFKDFKLKDYGISIINFFKYIYSQPYHMIIEEFVEKYINYLVKQKENLKLNKYNKFPHNLILSFDLINNKKYLIKNDKKDIIKDIYDFHLEFYGSKCEYYITYKRKKYNLLNDKDREEIYYIAHSIKRNEIIYLSEYYECSYFHQIILSFGNSYYRKEIKENIYYILKYNYNELSKEELETFQNILLNSRLNINNINIKFDIELFKKNPIYSRIHLNNNKLTKFDKKILTSNFKENIFMNYFLSNDYKINVYYNEFNKIKKRLIYNSTIIKYLKLDTNSLNSIYNSIEDNNRLIYKDLKIEQIDFFDIINYSNEGIYFTKMIYYFLDASIYLCKDIKTKEEIILVLDDFDIITFMKQIDKEYSKEFLNKIKRIKIKEI